MVKSRNVPNRGYDCLNFSLNLTFLPQIYANILSIIVATGVYALLLKFLQKNSPHNVQTKGGGVKGFLTMFKKLHFFTARLPLAESAKSESHRCYMYLRYRYFKFRNDPPPDHSISISSSSHMLY